MIEIRRIVTGLLGVLSTALLASPSAVADLVTRPELHLEDEGAQACTHVCFGAAGGITTHAEASIVYVRETWVDGVRCTITAKVHVLGLIPGSQVATYTWSLKVTPLGVDRGGVGDAGPINEGDEPSSTVPGGTVVTASASISNDNLQLDASSVSRSITC